MMFNYQTACDVIKALQNNEKVTEGSGLKQNKRRGLTIFLIVLLVLLVLVTGYAFMKQKQASKDTSSSGDNYVLAS